MAENFGINLDAAERETAYPDGIPVTRKGITFMLPSELPLDVFDPLLDPKLDLTGLIKRALESQTEDTTEAVLEVIFSRDALVLELRDAFYACIKVLFGEEQYEEWAATRPGLRTYGNLIRGLLREYGVGLGEAFKSPTSSGDAGPTSKETSPDTSPATTPDSSDVAPEPATDSSESGEPAA